MNRVSLNGLCTGCVACAASCAHQAICMTEQGVYGHFMPTIDTSKCVNCGICAKVCPQNVPLKVVTPQAAFAAWSKDEEDYHTSTSGGAASVLSTHVINEGGVVYGCASIGGDIKHIRVDKIENLSLLKGSKYVQSQLPVDIIRAVKADLRDYRKVLFVGTPCQVAGLKSYLHRGYDNLYTADIICHGVSSQKNLFENLRICGIERKNVVTMTFRKKGHCHLSVIGENGRELRSRMLHQDFYFIAFYRSANYNEVCYQCQYARPERVSDITLGDFWGCGLLKLQQKHDQGLSLVLINTVQGRELFEACKEKFNSEERSITEAVCGNKQLRQPSVLHLNHRPFAWIYKYFGFRMASLCCLLPDKLFYYLLSLRN